MCNKPRKINKICYDICINKQIIVEKYTKTIYNRIIRGESMKNLSRKKITNIVLIVIILLLTLIVMPNIVKADINPNDYKPGAIDTKDTQQAINIASSITGVLAVIGTITAVVALMIIGIKYMISSASERAEYKQTMLQYLIGALLVFGITQVLNLIVKIVTQTL